MQPCMFYVLSILFHHFMYVHVHGAIFPDVCGYGSILFSGRRVGDVTSVSIHIPNEKRTKLDLSGRKGIFVGYSDTSKAYRIYF